MAGRFLSRSREQYVGKVWPKVGRCSGVSKQVGEEPKEGGSRVHGAGFKFLPRFKQGVK